jgi:cbb3-type cytochrome oxidase subunit 3
MSEMGSGMIEMALGFWFFVGIIFLSVIIYLFVSSFKKKEDPSKKGNLIMYYDGPFGLLAEQPDPE